MEMAAETEEEARQYIENFWIPAVGSHVRFRKSKSELLYQIQGMDENYPEQITLRGWGHIAFLQDLEWVPDETEIALLLQRIGIKIIDNDVVQLGKAFGPMPKKYTEVSETLRTFRQVQLLNHGVDPYLVLTNS
jgi:hypothetical protein